jgi:hypothetical protein
MSADWQNEIHTASAMIDAKTQLHKGDPGRSVAYKTSESSFYNMTAYQPTVWLSGDQVSDTVKQMRQPTFQRRTALSHSAHQTNQFGEQQTHTDNEGGHSVT